MNQFFDLLKTFKIINFDTHLNILLLENIPYKHLSFNLLAR